MFKSILLISIVAVVILGALTFTSSSLGKVESSVSNQPNSASAFAQKRAVPRSEADNPATRSGRNQGKEKERRDEKNRTKNSRKSQAVQDAPITEITPMVVDPVKPKVFHGDLRQMRVKKQKPKGERPEPKELESALPETVDSSRQDFLPAAPAPTPSSNFAGLDFANWGAGWPPDTNGDVGPNHYIQTVNTSIGVYDKGTGSRLAAFTFDQFFSQTPTGTPCDNDNQGDPVVLYDALSDRWIITDFAWTTYNTGPFYQCMAVSQTGDPVSGGWYFYAWQTASNARIPDYPKLGVWPDGIYMSANVFSSSNGAFQNSQVWAFNRTEMESGATAHVVSFSLPATITGVQIFGLLPSNLRNIGGSLPAGTPNYFASIWALANRARVWKFHVDWAVPANSTFTGPTNVTISTFNAGPTSAPEQTGNNVDTLSYRLMMQNQYQNVGGTESLWLTHTVGSGAAPNVAQIRWYQLNVTGGTIVTAAPIQQGTWAPDTKHRFMPSLALDKLGDMALGYSVSDSTMFPSLRYAGRLSTDALNTLGQGETSLIEGTGYQCCLFSDGTTNTRWGDYSAMSIDPDGCTFWYTNEYYDSAPATLAQDNWKTRIGAFRYSQCTPNTVGILQGTVTDATTTNPISGALVSAGIYSLKTNASGFYKFSNLPTASYSVNVTSAGYSPGTANNVSVSTGATTIQNFALSPPLVTTNLSVNTASGTYGGTATLTATLTQQGGGALSGKTITFTLNGSSFAGNTATTNASGVATLSNVSLVGINAGNYPTGVGASFAAGGGFAASSGANSLTISKATPVITWSNPADIVYGTALSATQLNATTTVGGSFAYNPAAGVALHSGNSQTLSTTFTPADTTNYNNASKSVSLNVLKATLTATAQNKSKTYRATNPSLTYALTGFVNSDTQASATTGQPTLSTTATTTSVVASYPITIVVGTLAATDYSFSFVAGTLTVNKATPTITWSNPADIVYGTALSSTQLNATASNPNDSTSVTGSFSYNPVSGTILNSGNGQSLGTTFTPTDTANYNGATKSVSINVLKATPIVNWTNPSPINQGTALGATQLNATSLVAGTFTYNPPAGTVLPIGNNQTLMVTLTPADSVNYNLGSATVHINVVSADTIWVEDAVPAGAALVGTDGDSWNWVSSNPAPFSGSLAHQSNIAAGYHQHYFYDATSTLSINTGETLIASVYLDPANIPSEIMLQWNDGTWEHRAYWGANRIGVGVFMGPLPTAGQWVRLEVPASLVGLDGSTLNGMAFTLHGGRATWDYAGKSSAPPAPTPTPTPTPSPTPTPMGDTVWVEDSTPAGATLIGTDGDGWNWINSNPSPFSGSLAAQSNISDGYHQHYFYDASTTLTVNPGETLIAYVYLDPANTPREVMLQWNDGSWDHRAYWGANDIGVGVYMGTLPPSGQWTRLEVPASAVGLDGRTLNGMAFTLSGGRATWDYAGKSSVAPSPTPTPTPTPTPSPTSGDSIWVEDSTPSGATLIGTDGDGWNWISSNPSPISGALAHQSSIGDGYHQHYFFDATTTLKINAGDSLIAYVYLDPANPPREIMLQWNSNGSWEHRAYWGNNDIGAGVFMGALPAVGQWVRLEVPAAVVGLDGSTLNGMAFTLSGGRATWDKAGKFSP